MTSLSIKAVFLSGSPMSNEIIMNEILAVHCISAITLHCIFIVIKWLYLVCFTHIHCNFIM